jgi:hypothetical protein
MLEYQGAIHIHSIYSDGSGTIPEIIKAAQEVNLDFIVISDHNTNQAQKDGYEGWYDNLLLMVGYELNDKNDQNHYLVLGLDNIPDDYSDAKYYVDYVEKNDGLGFLAHPLEKRDKNGNIPPYPWTRWDIENYTGIEIWNHMSEWVEGLKENNKINRVIHPLKSINAPSTDVLKLWDSVNMKRIVPAIGSVDAHATKHHLGGVISLEIFAYKILFKSIRTHVFLEDSFQDKNTKNFDLYKKQLVKALREGNSFISNYYHGDARGFRFFASIQGKKYMMGNSFRKENNDLVDFLIQVPSVSEIRLLRNGDIIYQTNGMEVFFSTSDFGNYRVEVFKEKKGSSLPKGWIFSNNIRVLK